MSDKELTAKDVRMIVSHQLDYSYYSNNEIGVSVEVDDDNNELVLILTQTERIDRFSLIAEKLDDNG